MRDMGHDSAGSSLRTSLGLGLAFSDGTGLAASLDSLVAVLVVLLEVLKEITVLLRNLALLEKLDKESSEILQGLLVEVVLMGLHVTQLGEGLATVIKSADIRLQALVSLLMRADIAALGEELTTQAASEWLLSSVTAHVSLQVSAL